MMIKTTRIKKHLSRNSYHVKTSQLTRIANQVTCLHMTKSSHKELLNYYKTRKGISNVMINNEIMTNNNLAVTIIAFTKKKINMSTFTTTWC